MKKIAKGCLFVFLGFIFLTLVISLFTDHKNGIVNFTLFCFIVGFILWIRKNKKKSVNPIPEINKNSIKHFQKFELVIVGIHHNAKLIDIPRQALIREMHEYDSVRFERDLTNEVDKNAVYVLNDDNYDLGYVKKEETARIIHFLENSQYKIEAHVFKKYKIDKGYTLVLKVDVYEKS